MLLFQACVWLKSTFGMKKTPRNVLNDLKINGIIRNY